MEKLRQDIISKLPGTLHPEHAECIADEIIKLIKDYESKNHSRKFQTRV